METAAALASLVGLAQETRLAVFRLLVEVGPDGLAAGEIAGLLDIPAPTLSFHLRQLNHAHLVVSQRTGTSIRYAANFDTMNGLVAYLTEKCCGGDPSLCQPAVATGCKPEVVAK